MKTAGVSNVGQDLQSGNNQSGLLTARGLRSIFIVDMKISFLAGIPPNWKNLNHLFIHSWSSLELAQSLLSYCCNLVACLLQIERGGFHDNTIRGASISLSSPILPLLTFLSLQGDPSACTQLFGSIEAPSLQILDFQGAFPHESEEFGLLKFLQNINSLETLRLDHRRITERIALKYYPLFPSVTHLVFGRSPKRSLCNTYYRSRPSPGHANFLATLHEIKHQYSPDSAPTVPFPSLEVFEAYDVSRVTDIMLLEFIKARIDATKSNPGVSKLKKVLVEFSRIRQTDIVPEVKAYAQIGKRNPALDLTYYAPSIKLDETSSWSPSFGLTWDDASWVYPLYDYWY